MRRALFTAVLLFGATASSGASGAVRLSAGDVGVGALTVANGRAVAVVESGDATSPFELVITDGRGREVVGDFGVRDAEFPDIAVDTLGRMVAAWSRPVSGGSALEALAVTIGRDEPFGPIAELGQSTGPPRLAVADGGPLLAYPDREGNVALIADPVAAQGDSSAPRPAPSTITSSGPARRHLPLDVVIGPSGPLVLDLAQTRELTELRIVGSDAPSAPLTAAKGVRNIPAGMAADDERVIAAYVSKGRVVLATPRSDGSWRRTTLRGPGGAGSPPAVMLAGNEALVVYDQRVAEPGKRRRYRQLFLARLSGGMLETTRLATSEGDDASPIAASDPAGEAYVAWTRTLRGTRERIALLTRIQ